MVAEEVRSQHSEETQRASRRRARGERRRGEILEAAESLFADKGFDATRLEDVAERVGIRRASLVYYFRDKQELYDAVLKDVLDALLARVQPVFSSGAPLLERIEQGVSAWVDFVGQRPTFARLLLREVANAEPERPPALARYRQPFFDLVEREVLRGVDVPKILAAGIDPVHVASTIVGATVFYVAAMPSLLPERGELLSPRQIEKLREQVLRIVRRLIDTRAG